MGMTGGMKIFVIGIVLCIVGAVLSVLSITVMVRDPSVEARTTITFAPSEYTETAHFESGDYDIWYLSTSWIDLGPGDVTIEDQYGTVIYETPYLQITETITVNNREYKKIGTFTLQNTGNYNVTVEWSDYTLYFTPPISLAAGLGLCFGGVGIIIVGGILFIIGLILHFTRQKPVPQYPPQQYPPQQYPPQYPQQQYPPQQPPQQYPPPKR